MTGKSSYAKFEKNFVHKLRSEISHAENTKDVSNSFSYVAGAFLRQVTAGTFDLYDSDILFDHKTNPKFRFSLRLMGIKEFVNIINNSDTANIVGRFAETADHRFKHLNRHPLKSDLKIRTQVAV